ncbi:Rne/Rng family ribonuclease [Paenibacillus sp. L3-i20]|uniref:Rne/Rng family ribonuclease n=1 Tax=Paenibacillus sp. L3-i20 TaxID=2905833 RepID=UPI001EDDF8FC|nr:Rne/Rng family ribonuclease [Paenibacillus sp. L3-i20]GKU75713.1 ribonuclease G [Paenibacillus sp. L3-i20]
MKQMLMHVDGEMLQTAVLHDGKLVEFFMERSGGVSLVGNVYKGRIVNVLPGMGAAFVDIGLGRNAFLYIDDMLHPHADKQSHNKPEISELAVVGQEIIVQVIKDPLGGKGARVTTHYNLAGRWLVFMPCADYVGISKKIGNEGERERLRLLGEKLRTGEEGIIMRTAALGEDEEALGADVTKLRERWITIQGSISKAIAPQLLHSEAGLLHRAFRDTLTRDMDEVWIDNFAKFQEASKLLQDMTPTLKEKLKLFEQRGKSSMFQQFKVSEQVTTAFSRRIPMGSGGYLIWEDTEALTVIDVNTGKYVGSDNLEDTVFQTNMEAAQLISRLLRVRDVGGIIIIDFIDMQREESRQKILLCMTDEAKLDGTKCTIVGWTKLGLMELTRKKARENAIHQMKENCKVCSGTGKQSSFTK